jgi:hypothetical protein
MNRDMYESMKDELVVENISIDRIEPSYSKSQVRQAGERQSHVEALSEEIEARGQEVPITVEPPKKRHDGTSYYPIVEGNHRFLSNKHLWNTTKNTTYATIKAVVKVFKNDYERLEYQIRANNHTGVALKSSVDDAVVVLKSFVFSEKPISGAPPIIKRLYGSARLNITDPEAYKKMLKDAIKLHWPDYGAKKRDRIVNRFLLDPKLPGKFASFTAKSVRIAFDDWVNAESEYLGPVTAKGTELYTILPIKNDNWIDHSLMGLAFKSKTESEAKSGHINIAVMFWKDIAGKSFKDLDQHRINMIKRINKRNKSPLLKRGTRMIDEIYIVPQKRDGCDEMGFYRVPKTADGHFSISQIPESGWDTNTAANSVAA